MNKENSNIKQPRFVLNDMVKEKILKMYKISKNGIKEPNIVPKNNNENIS